MFQQSRRGRRARTAGAGALMLTGILAASPASAVDAEGRYAVRGAGAQACSAFVEALGADGPDGVVFVSWIEGYLTAHSLLADDTFDASPLVAPGEVAALLRTVCSNQPDLRMETAMARVINFFAPMRVRENSEVVSLAVGERTAHLRRETLVRVQERLRETGHDALAADGVFGPDTERALRAYQEAQGLPATGLPDAATIIRLASGGATGGAGAGPAAE